MRREHFRDLLAAEFGEAFAGAYFDRSGFSEGPPAVLYPWSYIAEDKFKQNARRFLEREGVKLGPAVVAHLKNPRQPGR